MNPIIPEVLTNPVALRVELGLVLGGVFVAATTVVNHREATHQSVETNPVVGLVGDVANMMTGTKSRMWAGAHLKHHSLVDADLLPTLKLKNYLEWRAENPDEAAEHPPVPELFPAGVLDPAAALTPDQVIQIGQETDWIVLDRTTGESVMDRYDPPQTHTKVEADGLLDMVTPRYFYAPRPSLLSKLRGQKPSLAEKPPERSLQSLAAELRDPHSPPLHRDGVSGILRQGIGLYRDVIAYQTEQEKIHGIHPDATVRRFEGKAGLGAAIFFGGCIAISGAMGLRNGGGLAEVSRAAGLGVISPTTAYGLYIAGSNAVNGLGHAGRSPGSILKSAWNYFQKKAPEAKDDGTFTSNSALAGAFTLDEAGAQDPHHRAPGRIAFSTKEGPGKLKQAPFGSFLEFLAKKGIGIRPGKQFGHPETSQEPTDFEQDLSSATNTRFLRPDEPSRPVLLLQTARRETAQKPTHQS